MTVTKLVSTVFFSTVVLLFLAGCSKSEEGEDKEHFASSQQRALEKAKGVEDMLQDAEEKRRKEMEQASQ